jgi:hypothetical protein
MAEVLPQSVDELLPGDVIQFADITELVAFEDEIVAAVRPDYDHAMWAGRKPLRDLMRPPRFNGTIANISLLVMHDAYEQLQTAKDRGIAMRITRRALSDENVLIYGPQYRGFVITADARSSGRGVVGQLQTEAWYYPLVPGVLKAGTVRQRVKSRADGTKYDYTYVRSSNGVDISKGRESGRTIGRIISYPKLEKDTFIELNESSRRIGAAALVKSMRSPFGGMHD